MKTSTNTSFIYKITFVAAVGGLLFGYDTAVISGAIGFLKTKFALTSAMEGWVASCVLVGCMIGTTFAGKLSDKIGRKKVLKISALLFAVSAIGTAIPESLTTFVIFRMIGGVGIGIASMLAPLYITESSPAEIRGRLVSINQLGIVSGILLIYFVNAYIAGLHDETWNISTGWRWMFGSGILPSVVFFILLFFVPESPRWLAKVNQWDKAKEILIKINGTEKADTELKEIKEALQAETAVAPSIFSEALRKPLIIGIILAIFSQVTGINAIMYYAPEIFKSTGSGSDSSMMQTVLVGVINLIATLVAIKYVDNLGRKALLLIGSAGMFVCLGIIGSAFYFGMLEGNIVLISILAYITFFGISLGPLTFVVIAEIFPNQTRGKAMSICIFALWASVFLVSQLFPILLDTIGSAFTFWIFMMMSLFSLIFVWKYLPETKGKTLEEIEKYWK